MNDASKTILAAGLMLSSACAFSFSPDLIKGCKVISEERKDASLEEAVHAAYCLGVIDGIFTVVSRNQTRTPIPDPCFTQKYQEPKDMAANIVKTLKERPKILEAARKISGRPGAMASFFALSIAYQCK